MINGYSIRLLCNTLSMIVFELYNYYTHIEYISINLTDNYTINLRKKQNKP